MRKSEKLVDKAVPESTRSRNLSPNDHIISYLPFYPVDRDMNTFLAFLQNSSDGYIEGKHCGLNLEHQNSCKSQAIRVRFAFGISLLTTYWTEVC